MNQNKAEPIFSSNSNYLIEKKKSGKKDDDGKNNINELEVNYIT